MNASLPIRRNAKVLPDSPAFVRNDGSFVTYASLERTVDTLAHCLGRLPCGPGDVASLDTTDLYRYVCVTLALARIGAAVAPANLPAGLATVAIGDAPAHAASAPRAISLREMFEVALPAPPSPLAIHADSDATFALCPSSGTTAGTPKFVPLSHALTRRRIAARSLSAPAIPGTRHVSMVGPASVFGLQRTLRTLWSGCAVVEPNLDAQQIPAWLVESGVTFMTLSPIGLRKILECLPDEGFRCAVAMIEIGGGLLPAPIQEMAARRLPALLITAYGSTETGPMATAPMSVLAGRPGAVGFPLAGVEIEALDDQGRAVPAGSQGILRVRSPHTASAYVGNTEATARTFRDGWVYPNDNGIIDADGAVRLLGRTDDVINTNGVKINPQAIEDVLLTLADLREVAVFGAPNAEGMISMCAAIVPNQPINAAAFHERCRVKLGQRAPAVIMHLRELPRNAMGKVLRTELARMAIEASPGAKPSRGQ